MDGPYIVKNNAHAFFFKRSGGDISISGGVTSLHRTKHRPFVALFCNVASQHYSCVERRISRPLSRHCAKRLRKPESWKMSIWYPFSTITGRVFGPFRYNELLANWGQACWAEWHDVLMSNTFGTKVMLECARTQRRSSRSPTVHYSNALRVYAFCIDVTAQPWDPLLHSLGNPLWVVAFREPQRSQKRFKIQGSVAMLCWYITWMCI